MIFYLKRYRDILEIILTVDKETPVAKIQTSSSFDSFRTKISSYDLQNKDVMNST